MRILQVNDLLPGPGAGGAEVHLARLIAGLRDAGDQVDVFAGEVHHEGVAKALDAWDPFARRALAARVAAFDPDIIHFHHVARELSASVLGVGGGVPKVMTVQDFRILGLADHTGRPLLDLLQRGKSVLDRAVARRHVDVAIGVSEPMASALRGAGFRRVVHLPNFADTPTGDAPPPPSTCLDIAFAGRLTPDKGVHELVGAFESLAADHPGTSLLIAGDGSEAGALEAVAERRGDGRIRLLGRLAPEDVGRFFAQARVVAIPSIASLRPEGLPLVATEAAIAGRPLVVGDDPGLRSFVEDCGCGDVVAVVPGSPEALAKALDIYLRDPAVADDVGAAGRAAAIARYTTESVVAEVRALYRDLLSA
jgi:glycogen(starch) synthase